MLLVGVAVAGAWWVGRGRDVRASVSRALDALAAAPAVRYRDPGCAVPLDVRVTAHDDVLGTVHDGRNVVRVLRLGGRLFVQPPVSTGGPGRAHQWIEHSPDLARLVPDLLGPSRLVARLRSDLDATPGLPGDATTYRGRPAVRVALATSVVVVTDRAPYRVLAFRAPTGGAGAAAGRPPAAALRAAAEPPDDLTGVDPLDDPATRQTYTDLESAAQQLGGAADAEVLVTPRAQARLRCGVIGGCTVTDMVSVAVTTASGRVVTASVSVSIIAFITVDGQNAGECAAGPVSLPPGVTGTLTCIDPAAGLLIAEAFAVKRAEAGPGSTVVVETAASVGNFATAVTPAQVGAERARLAKERDAAVPASAEPAGTSPRGPPLGRDGTAALEDGLQQTPVDLRDLGLNPKQWNGDDRLAIEAALGGDLLPAQAKTFDDYLADDGGIAVSIKTFDTRSSSYVVSPGLLFSNGKGYIDAIVAHGKGIDLRPQDLPPSVVSHYVLKIAYPAGATARQIASLQKLVDYGQQQQIPDPRDPSHTIPVIVQIVPVLG